MNFSIVGQSLLSQTVSIFHPGDLSFSRDPAKKSDLSVSAVTASGDKMDTDEFSSDNENENEPVLLPLKVIINNIILHI